MHRVVLRRVHLADQDLAAGQAMPRHQSRRRRAALERLAAAVRRLVEAVDDDGVVGRRALEPVAQVRVALGVGEPARIDDQRPAQTVGLDRQRVVVAVAAVADRAAVEQQEALVGERLVLAEAAALDGVAAVLEPGRAVGRRRARATAGGDPAQVVAAEQAGGQLEVGEVAAAVGVGQRGNLAVRTMAVQREGAGGVEAIGESGRQLEVEAGRRSRRCRGTTAARSGGSASSARAARRRAARRPAGSRAAPPARRPAARRRRPGRAARGRRRTGCTARTCGGCARPSGSRGRRRRARRSAAPRSTSTASASRDQAYTQCSRRRAATSDERASTGTCAANEETSRSKHVAYARSPVCSKACARSSA